jgi:hypothetical protein
MQKTDRNDSKHSTRFTRMKASVDAYISSVGESPAQKSKEWYLIKSKTIGGSEVATVLGINPFRSVKELIAEKVGISRNVFTGNMATRWGIMFEQLTKEWTEHVLDMEECIKETGSVPGAIQGQRYSPDGLGVVKLINDNDKSDYFIVLFEFKSPLRSIPEGIIPKYYAPQIQTGMLTIPMVEISIFVNNCFRKCAMSDIGFNTVYDKVFHDGDDKKRKKKSTNWFDSVLACGFIGFYQTSDSYKLALKEYGYDSDSESESEMELTESLEEPQRTSTVHDMDILMNTAEEPIDFGRAKYPIMNRAFELYEEKRIKIIYYPMILNNEVVNELEFVKMHKKKRPLDNTNPKKIIQTQLDQFEEFCESNNHYPVGYLPWKLFKSDIIIETPDSTWKDTIETKIKDTLNLIDTITRADNPCGKYLEYFPNTGSYYADEVQDVVVEDNLMNDVTDDTEEVVDL